MTEEEEDFISLLLYRTIFIEYCILISLDSEHRFTTTSLCRLRVLARSMNRYRVRITDEFSSKDVK